MEQIYTPKQNYKVLVHTITYNQAKYITDTLDGVAMQQTNFPFVHYVIDDCSTDGEQEVIKAWLNGHCDMTKAEYIDLELANVILVPHKTNTNLTFAIYLLKRNLWKEPELKGTLVKPWRDHCEYEALCEGDDYWIKSLKLQMQVDYMNSHPECGLCYTDYSKLFQTEQRVIEDMFESGSVHRSLDGKDHLVTRGFIAPMSWMWRNEVFKKIGNVGSHTDGSYAIALEFYMYSQVQYIPITTSIYRVNDTSVTNQKNPKRAFHYLCGLFKTQREYADKMQLTDAEKGLVHLDGYTRILPQAIELGKMEYVHDAIEDAKRYNVSLSEIVNALLDKRAICSSVSFKLGNAILAPIRKIIHKSIKNSNTYY